MTLWTVKKSKDSLKAGFENVNIVFKLRTAVLLTSLPWMLDILCP